MVRVNLIKPGYLADQHLIAEYNEILMLVEYIRRRPCLDGIPEKYCLGTGHQKFFKDKLIYLKKRHDALKKEMKLRGFVARKSLDLNGFNKNNLKDWKPVESDIKVIKKRLRFKIKLKPSFYRYKGKYKDLKFFMKMLR